MRFSRVWTDADGESRLEWLTPEFGDTENYAQGVPVVGTSKRLPAGEAHFLRFPAGWVGDWHPAPARQFWALLEGTVGVETADGEETLVPGDCGLLEDTTGKGHRSWAVGDQAAVLVMVTLAEE